ncbi:MAG: glycerate kinase [Pirellulaceae bacterium]
MKVLIAPDSFKGSLTTFEAAHAMADGVQRALPTAEIKTFPMADGGEGTLAVIVAVCGGTVKSCKVAGVDGKPIAAEFGLVEIGGVTTAVIEIAQVVGITKLSDQSPPVERRTTLGIGELILAAVDAGCRNVLVGLGGSSTNDAGVGLLSALGIRFLDAAGNELDPCPTGLGRAARIDATSYDRRIGELKITILSDVQNVLAGERGATAVFGPQKGVRAEQVEPMDSLLRRIGRLGDEWVGRPVSQLPGSGAAGGLGWALQLIGGEFRSGAEMICELNGFDQAVKTADWVITGEGRSDQQTLDGKAPSVIARKARDADVPVTLLSGSLDSAAIPALSELFTGGCWSATPPTMNLKLAMESAAELLKLQAQKIALAQNSARGT